MTNTRVLHRRLSGHRRRSRTPIAPAPTYPAIGRCGSAIKLPGVVGMGRHPCLMEFYSHTLRSRPCVKMGRGIPQVLIMQNGLSRAPNKSCDSLRDDLGRPLLCLRRTCTPSLRLDNSSLALRVLCPHPPEALSRQEE